MGDLEAAGHSAATIISRTAQLLTKAGIERARAEAEVIVRAATGLTSEELLLRFDKRLSPEQASRVQALAARRAGREPLAYVLGEADFLSLPFRVSSGAMVPRPETEILAEAAIERAPQTALRAAADVGTGCGVLAVVLALNVAGLRVLAIDVCHAALILARENLRLHHVEDRTLLLRGDLLEAVGRRVDLIVANLPYVPSGEIDRLQPEIGDFEPRIALNGGTDGLGIVRRLSVQLIDHLSRGGFAALEVGAGQAPEVANLLERGGLSDIELIRDYAGIDRVVIGWRRG